MTAHSQPFFSVIITSYNYAEFIQRSINSVLAQTFSAYELIVVDDGSSDNTAQKVKQNYANRVRYFYKSNGGQSSAINYGVRHAKGKFVYVLDADDELMPDALAQFYAAIQRLTSAGQQQIFYAGYLSVSSDGKHIAKHATVCPQQRAKRFELFLADKIVGLKNGGFVAPISLFDQVQYPEGLKRNTDIVFLAQALLLLPASHIPHIVVKSHAHAKRLRKNLQLILSVGTKPVDFVFSSPYITPDLKPYKKIFIARRFRSMARILFAEKQYRQSKNMYINALLSYPACMLNGTSMIKLVLASWRSIFYKD